MITEQDAAPHAEPPSPRATLRIEVGPDRGIAEGNVPDDQARHLITTFGILGSTCAGIGGAVLTLRGHPSLSLLPIAELGLGFVASVLIAVCGFIAGKRQEKRDLSLAHIETGWRAPARCLPARSLGL